MEAIDKKKLLEEIKQRIEVVSKIITMEEKTHQQRLKAGHHVEKNYDYGFQVGYLWAYEEVLQELGSE